MTDSSVEELRGIKFASAATRVKEQWEPYGYRVYVNTNQRRIVITDEKFICPECGCPGRHITSADCIKALKERVAQLEK